MLPFQNVSDDRSHDYLQLAIPDQVTTDLSYSSSLAIRPASLTQRFTAGQTDPKAAGKELRVSKVVTGQYLREGDRWHITLELVDVDQDQVTLARLRRCAGQHAYRDAGALVGSGEGAPAARIRQCADEPARSHGPQSASL